MKKILLTMLMLVLGLALVACGGSNSSNSNSSDSNNSNSSDSSNIAQEKPERTNSGDGYEKFSQLKIGMTESEVHAILGEPTRVDKAYYYYNVIVNGNDLELTVWIDMTTGLVTYYSGEFSASEYRAEFADSKTDLSGVNGLKSEEITTYDECVKAFKTPGYLMNMKENGSYQCLWVDDDDSYIRVSFDADGNVKSYAGLV